MISNLKKTLSLKKPISLQKMNPHSVVFKIASILLFMSMITAIISYIGITKIRDIHQVANDIFFSNSNVLYPLADVMELVVSIDHAAVRGMEGDGFAISQISGQLPNVMGQVGNFESYLSPKDAAQIGAQMEEYGTVLRNLYNELSRNNGAGVSTLPIYNDFRTKSENLYNNLYELNKKSRIQGLETYTRGKKIYNSVILLQTWVTIFGVLVAIFIGIVVSISIIRPLQKLRNTTEVLALGDLSVRVDIPSKDEVGAVAAAFNKAIDELRSMVTEATVDAENINSASNNLFKVTDETTRSLNELRSLVDELSNGASIQFNTVNSAITSVKKAIAGADSVILATSQINTACNEASVAAERGKEAAHEMTETINVIVKTVSEINQLVKNLARDSSSIQNMLEGIREIAEKTNLLSLNASIEAARAGEHGRGFEIVATNMRQLSVQAQESVENIEEIIGNILTNTNHTVKMMENGNQQVNSSRTTLIETANLFQELIKQVDQIVSSIHLITNTAAQMNDYDQIVIDDISRVCQISEDNLASVQEVSATFEEQLSSTMIINDAALQLKVMANQLSEVAGRFKI